MENVAFTFKCPICGETHVGMPTFGADKPVSYFAVPEHERESRCEVSTDACVIDGNSFFVRGCIEIPVHGYSDPFIWGVWVSLSKESFDKWRSVFDRPKRSHIGPFLGWLNAWLKPYPDTVNLKTRVHLRDAGIRPFIELEPTDHPLAVEQRAGISVSRVAEIYSMMMHDPPPNTSDPAWQFQHSVDCNAPRHIAWSYWTDIANWNDPPAIFRLDGPFVAGSRLTTSLPGQTLHSLIRDVVNGPRTDEAIIEMQLPGAILLFQWKFESLSGDRTRITQRMTLSGANAGTLVAQASMLEKRTPEGMDKLVGAIERTMKAV